jgi:hypothetical protein
MRKRGESVGFSVFLRGLRRIRQFLQMGRDGEAWLGGGEGEIAEPGAGAAFEAGEVAAEARALGRVGGEVGHGGKRMKVEG